MAKQEYLFTTVKAENFGDENEISVTCNTCKANVNFLGSFETIFQNRRAWIKDHSCEISAVPNYIIGSGVANGHN